MRKHLLILASAALACVAIVVASTVYSKVLVNEPGLTYNNTYTLDTMTIPNAGGIDSLSAQAVYSTTTYSASTFTDGRVSTASLTVLDTTSLTSLAATNQITLANTATILAKSATDYITVLSTFSLLSSSAVITYNGNPLRAGHEWNVVATTTGTAANITTAINKFSGVLASRSNSTVNLSALPAGGAGNNKTLAVNVSSITIGGSKFGGGYFGRLDTAYLQVNGRRFPTGVGWTVANTSSGTATNIAHFLNLISGIKASASGSVVYATATVSGIGGNAFTLVSSQPSYMTVASPTFTGGRNNANVCINGTCVVQGTDWTKVSTASGTAKAISDAIMAKSALSSVLSSTWTSSVVSATSTATGSAQNFTFTTNNPTALTLVAFTGGSDSAFSTGGSNLHIPTHGYTSGLGVVYSTSTNVTISPLKWGTTYYVAKISASDIALSTSQVNALAGSYIALGTQSKVGPHTFTLTPQLYTGTASMAWLGSNNRTDWSAIDISSVTYSSPSGVASTLWDFGDVNYRYIQLSVVAPTQGGLDLVVTVNGKR